VTSQDPDKLQSPRLFYALWPDETVRGALVALQASLPGRLTLRDNLHLTLAFLGCQPATLLPALGTILSQLPASSFLLTFDNVGCFTRRGIVWAGMRQTPLILTTLQAHLEQLLAQQGITFDRQPAFKPHVTLARYATAAPQVSFEPIRWQAEQVALVQSVNEKNVVRYRVLASRRLDGATS
jgi:2'-5' RNA ligase